MNDHDTQRERPPARIFHPGADEAPFVRRVFLAVAITGGSVLGTMFVWQAANVLLLLFGGLILAAFLRSVTDLVSQRAHLSDRFAFPLVLLVLAVLLVATTWFLGSTILDQVEVLSHSLASSSDRIRAYLEEQEWGPPLLRLSVMDSLFAGERSVLSQITGIFSAAFGVLSNVVVVLFVGIFVAANPTRYEAGILRLIPIPRRIRARQVLETIGKTLQWWIIGRLLDMFIVGLLTTIGLWLLGTPVPLALGLLTFLIVFIPYLGPFLSVLPAVLVALSQGPTQAFNVALLYLVLQGAESYLLFPFIQDRSVKLPPAVVIGSQLLVGVLAGWLGLMLATPLVAALAVALRLLYVEDVLGDHALDPDTVVLPSADGSVSRPQPLSPR